MSKKNTLLISTLLSCFVSVNVSCSLNGYGPSDETEKELSTHVISTNLLYSNLALKDLRIVDVRSAEEFSKGNIPNSINIPFEVPFSTWTTMKGELLVEVPELSQLAAALGEKGISNKSNVVLVTSLPTATNPYSLASPTRVALTLAYAGLENVAVLDGGYDKWVSEGKPVTTEIAGTVPTSFTAKENKKIFVGIEYVKQNIKKIPIIDARDAAVYAGTVIEPWANKAGHIPTAVSLPAPELWNADGTYKSREEISTIVQHVLSIDKNKEVIVYCGVGGYASTVWFALSKILGYKKVLVFDGSSQEWASQYDMVISQDQNK